MTRLLIVDDEITIRNGLATAIPWEEYGFSVAALAKNGIEALKLFQDNRIDMIISDVKMPQLDGIELLKRVHAVRPEVPFIFISGYDEFELAQKAVNNGAFAYLLKPIDVDELMDILKHARDILLKKAIPKGSLQDISKPSDLLPGKNIDKLIEQAKQYIEQHYADPYLSMPEVADAVGLNPSYFSAEFTKHESLCFINYLTDYRITQSKRLLTSTDDKIQVVSEAVGYLNATYYSTLFRRAEGMTPSQYRKNHSLL